MNSDGGSHLDGPGADAGITLYRLQAGVYSVTGPVVVGNDGCMVNPNDAANPTAGLIFALLNDGLGNVKLGNPTDPSHPSNPQQYDTQESGTPPQPAQGASCPKTNPPSQCATQPGVTSISNNMGWLVRDNDVTSGTCMFHRHLANQLTLTADNTFTASYSRTDTNHMTCPNIPVMTDCTTTWTWQFSKVKDFGQ